MILFYKNSFLASVVSIFGCILIFVFVTEFDSYDLSESIPAILAGIALLVSGKLISVEKSFKTWWKQVKQAGLDEKMKTDAEVAKYVYSKNPKARTLKEIAKLNPEAAAQISASK